MLCWIITNLTIESCDSDNKWTPVDVFPVSLWLTLNTFTRNNNYHVSLVFLCIDLNMYLPVGMTQLKLTFSQRNCET